MAVSKAQQRATNKWIAKAYDRVNLTLPKGQKEVLQAHASSLGESVNGFIGRAISETMDRDAGKRSGSPQEPAGAPRGALVSLPSDTLKVAQEAAEAAGEGLSEFITRAVLGTAERDRMTREGG